MFEFLVIASLATVMAVTDKGKTTPKRSRERLVGGLGDGRKPSEFNQRELKAGIQVEMEHTKSRAVAREIAMDHLTEHRDYYKGLRVAESRMAGPTPRKQK